MSTTNSTIETSSNHDSYSHANDSSHDSSSLSSHEDLRERQWFFNEEEDDGKQLGLKFFKKLFNENKTLYYSTAYLNEKLYLHYKGIKKI